MIDVEDRMLDPCSKGAFEYTGIDFGDTSFPYSESIVASKDKFVDEILAIELA